VTTKIKTIELEPTVEILGRRSFILKQKVVRHVTGDVINFRLPGILIRTKGVNPEVIWEEVLKLYSKEFEIVVICNSLEERIYYTDLVQKHGLRAVYLYLRKEVEIF
jgi:hypothetical protein